MGAFSHLHSSTVGSEVENSHPLKLLVSHKERGWVYCFLIIINILVSSSRKGVANTPLIASFIVPAGRYIGRGVKGCTRAGLFEYMAENPAP